MGVEALAALQDMLYAQDRWAVLLIFQAMDAAGKDGAIKHVMSGVNPQGCQVASFKAPSAEDLDHDYLWRCQTAPAGARPHRHLQPLLLRGGARGPGAPEILEKQKLPSSLVDADVFERRYEDIRAHEDYLAQNGVLILKFFLHVSREEQKRRFLERLEDPDKNWKFSANDAAERAHWKKYMKAYEEAIRHTATPHAPWYVVPADNKWYTRIVVASAVVDALASLDLHYPKVGKAQRAELAKARRALLAEK